MTQKDHPPPYQRRIQNPDSPSCTWPVFNTHWILFAPWAHPAWHSYYFVLMDLTREMPNSEPPYFYRSGMTHQLDVHAMNPDHAVPILGPDNTDTPSVSGECLLLPTNHSYQFKTNTDEAALTRIESQIIQPIVNKSLSPDTDAKRTWDAIFADGAQHPERIEATHRLQ